ncbi:MAG: hypothetical protein WD016_10845 [Balneolaceae bacterium]
MKTPKKYLLIGLITLLFGTFAEAQNFDANRMNRDIKIMENILDELFKIDARSDRNGIHIALAGSNLTNVKGTYLPGYGVIFKIPQITHTGLPSSISVDNGGGNRNVSFYYKTDDNEANDKAISEETITTRITEFLQDYASTIGQLKDDENVLVIYGSQNNGRRYYVVRELRIDSDEEESKPLPIISVSVSKKDLEAVRSGGLQADAFKERLSISKSANKEYLDLKVMSNIFETALRDASKNSFQLSGHVNYLMLENFGALFSLNLRYNYGENYAPAIFGVREFRTAVTRARNIEAKQESEEEMNEKQEETEAKIAEDYEKFKTDIKEYIVDYGRTLSSVSSDQFILTTATINKWANNDVPERLDIQIKKSVLEQLDKGAISRDQALKQVTITEY